MQTTEDCRFEDDANVFTNVSNCMCLTDYHQHSKVSFFRQINYKYTKLSGREQIIVRPQHLGGNITACSHLHSIVHNQDVYCILHISGPDKTDENLPNYPGFEKDVFRVVKDYFCGLSEPLMTFNMYEVITNVFGKYRFLEKEIQTIGCLGYLIYNKTMIPSLGLK